MYRVFIYQSVEDFVCGSNNVISLEFGDINSAMGMVEDLARCGVAVFVGRENEDE